MASSKQASPAASAVPAVPPRMAVTPQGIPVEASGRHVHLTQEAMEVLFGPGAALNPKRPLSQTGQFLAQERVGLVSPKAALDKVAILGPLRSAVQVELSLTDAAALGIKPPIRISGNLEGAADLDIVGPAGTYHAKGAVIIAARHLHLRPKDAIKYGLRNGQTVSIRVRTERPVIFEKVAVRVSESAMPAFHIDCDEANSCMLSRAPGPVYAEILKDGSLVGPKQQVHTWGGSFRSEKLPKAKLITESEAKRLAGAGSMQVSLPRGTLLTPSAKDVFLHSRCTIVFED
jgi:propanediol utilization protein